MRELLAGDGALHAERRVTRDAAEVRVLAGLERDGQLGALARLEQRRLLPVDLEVVRDLALVRDDEGHRAVRGRSRRQLELELRGSDGDRLAGRVRTRSERR